MNLELQKYFESMFVSVDPNIKLDEEQQKAILCENQNVMIIAGAGAGKTTTMSAKVKYLIEKKGVRPEEIVMISYTNKAVEELKKRIHVDFNLPIEICTFHKLGLNILKMANVEKRVLENSSLYIKNIMNQCLLKDEKWSRLILRYLSYYNYVPWSFQKRGKKYQKLKSRIEYCSLLGQVKKRNLFDLKNLEQEKLNLCGEYMDSPEELMVANFLFLHNIRYTYKAFYEYDKSYIPDFCIYDESGNPYYLELLFQNFPTYGDFLKRERTIRRIRRIHHKFNTRLLELEIGENFLSDLRNLLLENGFCFIEKSSLEVFEVIRDLKSSLMYKNFFNLCCTFLHCFKLSGFGLEQFDRWLMCEKEERTRLFLQIMREVYLLYQNQLCESGYCDFEDMIKDAESILKKKKLKLSYRYIIVDEYQDISRVRFLFLKTLVEVTGAKLIVVGDDWQSIFSFAGSDVRLFFDFHKIMGDASTLKITHTYRNSQELIDSVGHFVMKNDSQLKKNLISPKHLNPSIYVYLYDGPKEKASILERAIEMIVDKFGDETEILLLGRYRFDLYSILNKKYFLLNGDGQVCSVRFPKLKLIFMTVHASKGLGFGNVILINGEEGEYGFPSEKVNDPIMDLVICKKEEFEYAEERRLFYVALTRTKNFVCILSPIENTSRFVLELSNVKVVNFTGRKWKNKSFVCPYCHSNLVRNDWNSKGIFPLYQCVNNRKVCGFETNDLDYKKRIIVCPKCKNGYLIVVRRNYGVFWRCTRFGKGCDYEKEL